MDCYRALCRTPACDAAAAELFGVRWIANKNQLIFHFHTPQRPRFNILSGTTTEDTKKLTMAHISLHILGHLIDIHTVDQADFYTIVLYSKSSCSIDTVFLIILRTALHVGSDIVVIRIKSILVS